MILVGSEGNIMADYEKMYAVLCGAIDDVIEPLERIPLARSSAAILRSALLRAEEIYVQTPPPVLPFPNQNQD